MAAITKRRLVRIFNRLAYAAGVFTALIIVSALLFWGFTDYSLFDSFYWAIVTAFTVGYGDVLPVTLAAKVLTMFLIPTSALTYLFVGAHIVGDVLDDRNKFTDEEQDWQADALKALLDANQVPFRAYPDSSKHDLT